MSEEIRFFISKFFSDAGARMTNKGNLILIDHIPKDIQDFLGKKEPYLLAVDESGLIEDSEAELISKGSLMVKNISDYMSNKGQATILKIDFSKQMENLTMPIFLKEGEIFQQDKKETIESLLRFTFSTEFQYLNQTEQLFTDLFVQKGSLIDLDLSKFSLEKGDPKDAIVKDVREDYILAKNSIKYKLKTKLDSISTQLETKLDKEIERINKHYLHQEEELNLQLSKLTNQLAGAKEEGDGKKIERIESEITQFKEKLNDRVREIEKNFFIQDEINKHSLNINTRLMNTTLIYYPNFIFKTYLRNGKVIRSIELSFDPFNNKFSSVSCDSCKYPVSEIFLCNSGHIACGNCVKGKCGECNLSICKACTKKECFICKKTLCKKCDKQCASCFKPVCSQHGPIEKATKKVFCNECGRACCKCNNWFENKKLKVFGPKKICEACFRLNSLNGR